MAPRLNSSCTQKYALPVPECLSSGCNICANNVCPLKRTRSVQKRDAEMQSKHSSKPRQTAEVSGPLQPRKKQSDERMGGSESHLPKDRRRSTFLQGVSSSRVTPHQFPALPGGRLWAPICAHVALEKGQHLRVRKLVRVGSPSEVQMRVRWHGDAGQHLRFVGL